MVELADTPDLGSGARACRFKSCYPHIDIGEQNALLYLYADNREQKKERKDYEKTVLETFEYVVSGAGGAGDIR